MSQTHWCKDEKGLARTPGPAHLLGRRRGKGLLPAGTDDDGSCAEWERLAGHALGGQHALVGQHLVCEHHLDGSEVFMSWA